LSPDLKRGESRSIPDFRLTAILNVAVQKLVK